jgi:hypothetical protein
MLRLKSAPHNGEDQKNYDERLQAVKVEIVFLKCSKRNLMLAGSCKIWVKERNARILNTFID